MDYAEFSGKFLTFAEIFLTNTLNHITNNNQMRKTVYLAAVAAMALTSFASCKDNKEEANTANGNATSKVEAPADSTGKHDTPMAAYIRYVDSQKILVGYTLAAEVAKADSAAQVQFASYSNQLGAGLQRRQQQIQEKVQRNGYLSEASYNADVAAFQKAQQDAEAKLAQRQRDYATDLAMKQAELTDSLASVINDISKKYKLDAVLERSAGLYFNPALDITDEVLFELNRRYKPAK